MSKEQINEMKKFMQISEGNEDINTCGVCNKKFRWVGNPEDTMCPSCEKEYHGIDESEETCRCGRKDCKCGPECDCEPVKEDSKFSDKPHKYTYVYTDKQGNKTYIGVWYTEGNAVPKIRLWNEDRLPYAITNVMFMRDGSDQYLTDLFKEEVMNAFFDEETDEPRVADTQDVLDAVRDATRLGKAIMPVQNEAVDEDRDVDGMGHYNVIYHDDEIETALPYDQAIAKAKEFIEGVWLGKPPKVKKISKGDSVVFAWVDGNERDQVTIEPTDDADVDAWYGESISLSNIVKDLLNEGPELGKSQLIKDYADENDFDYTDLAMQDEEPGADEPEYPEADNQELSPRNVAWPKGVSIVDADDELEEDADDMDADNDGVIDDENIELDDLSINVDLEDF